MYAKLSGLKSGETYNQRFFKTPLLELMVRNTHQLYLQQCVTWVLLPWKGGTRHTLYLRRFQKINVNKSLHHTVSNLPNNELKPFTYLKNKCKGIYAAKRISYKLHQALV